MALANPTAGSRVDTGNKKSPEPLIFDHSSKFDNAQEDLPQDDKRSVICFTIDDIHHNDYVTEEEPLGQ